MFHMPLFEFGGGTIAQVLFLTHDSIVLRIDCSKDQVVTLRGRGAFQEVHSSAIKETKTASDNRSGSGSRPPAPKSNSSLLFLPDKDVMDERTTQRSAYF
jgi:hypothetical protein